MSIRGGIVLAGGRGERMGGNKAGVDLGGKTLVDRTVAILTGVGCDPVLVAGDGDDGPLAALVQPLKELQSFEVFVLACDLPLAGPAVTRLAELPAGAAVAVDPNGREQPLCSRWPRAVVLEAAQRLVISGERRMTALLDDIDPEFVVATTDELLNVNTPSDLERAAKLL